MRVILVLLGLGVLILVVMMSLGMVSVGGGSMPTVSVQGGAAPKVDVGRIDVGTVNKTVAVPVIDVQRADNAAAPR